MKRSAELAFRFDWIIIVIYLSLALIGWLSIYSSDFNDVHPRILDFSQNYGRQFIWIMSSFIVATCLLIIDSKFYTTFSYHIYAVILVLLLAVLVFGTEVAGSKSWFQIGTFKMQPSELAKFATTLAIAKYLSSTDVTLGKLKTKVALLVIIGIPAALTVLQGDAGSALVYTGFVLVLYREGLSGEILIYGLTILVLFILALKINKFILILSLLLVAAIISFRYRKNKYRVGT